MRGPETSFLWIGSNGFSKQNHYTRNKSINFDQSISKSKLPPSVDQNKILKYKGFS